MLLALAAKGDEGLVGVAEAGQPPPPEGNMIKWAWFRRYADIDRPIQFDSIIQSWDTASKAEEIHDFSVCTTWGIKGVRITCSTVYRQRLEYPQLKRMVVELPRNHAAPGVLIEDTGSGTPPIQDLYREGEIRPIPITPPW